VANRGRAGPLGPARLRETCSYCVCALMTLSNVSFPLVIA